MGESAFPAPDKKEHRQNLKQKWPSSQKHKLRRGKSAKVTDPPHRPLTPKERGTKGYWGVTGPGVRTTDRRQKEEGHRVFVVKGVVFITGGVRSEIGLMMDKRVSRAASGEAA